MEDLCERIERAALLRAIRILAERAHAGKREAGSAFLAKICAGDTALLHTVCGDADDDLGWILDTAEQIAAGGAPAATNKGDKPCAYLGSVFNHFGAIDGAAEGFPVRRLTDTSEMLLPQPLGELEGAEQGLRALYDTLAAYFERKAPMQMRIGELLRVLEETMSYVPSPAAEDISLYDYARMTAAYAAALYRYGAAHDIPDAATYTQQNGGSRPAFLLVSADISGIQPFIYAIPSRGALKSLRGRSFYLEILLENIADELLTACGISRSALLYTGGGHFYMLLPNTEDVQDILVRCHAAVNDWMLQHFGSNLYLAMAWTACTPNELAGQGTQEVFRRVSEKLSAEKLCRYSEEQLAEMFTSTSDWNKTRDAARECAVCHTSVTQLEPYPADPTVEACGMCAHLFTFGERILKKNAFCVSCERGAAALSLPGIGRTLYLTAEDPEGVDRLPYKIERIYTKNTVYTGDLPAAHLRLGDYSARENDAVLEMETLARRSGGTEDSRGIPRIGVMRADVDNLGAAFLAGFPAAYATMTRTAALSQQLSLFFKHYINDICRGKLAEPFSLLGREKKAARDVHIVYSGGDDIFLLGAWDDIVELAVDLRRAFLRFTSGKLRFSAGLGFFRDKCPVAEMARRTGDLESRAKDQRGADGRPQKDSVALFGAVTEGRSLADFGERAQVYGWDTFIERVCGEKLAFLRAHCIFEEGAKGERLSLGKSAVYRLLTLLEQDGPIQLARFAYALARLAPPAQSPAQEAYTRVRTQLYEWYRDPAARRQLSTALQLIIYSIREKGERSNA
ncbi:type III-A CRISPR-associated protein Cas10/Csm1 [uncultured Selenomonas sp.]|uniref:type III-A CRISPR-associated protein Cas10/Csm1 n=1 Tax=uncultured Selenomonas sp. TaxID=159275 RepID=UPI0028E2D602|nr:type III-A CRISPR-associated protein Cas10/Csm1 [uncultured Selenomonas sp.]